VPNLLPTPAPPRARARLRVLLAVTALLVATAAWALEVDVSGPRVRGTYVIVEARLADMLDERVRNSLERGMPATLELHTELWRRRGMWFDRLEQSFDASVRVHYEVWDAAFRIERPGAAAERFTTVDSVAAFLARPWGVPVARVQRLQFGVRYYAVVNATLRPLSVEDVNEVEGWLAGRGSLGGLGVLTELPRSLFDAVRNVAGFGDRRARALTNTFVADTLAASER
jgi:hypothetical protein